MPDSQDDAMLGGIAIIGVQGRFPGAATIDALWENLRNGVASIRFFGEDELDPGIEASHRTHPDYVRARGILHDADKFDAAFFGITPREAEIMDPQQRVFLESCWAALEDAGYTPEAFDGLIGVYAGMANNTYYPRYVAHRNDRVAAVGAFQAMLANEKDFLATRVSHKLNLTGPSVSLYTGCSTALVAVVQAYFSLMSYQCDLALAGGVTITAPQESGYLYQEGGIESRDGHCRPFDAAADGTVFSNGVGVVVLKRLEEAVEDGDTIHAVIRGAAINNDGAVKVSFAAPSVAGQASVIAMAQAQADVHPETITYIEAHGTATRLGDPIEIEALTQAFRAKTDEKQFCAIGSIKSNMGHLLAAAGIAGLIKTVLALQHRLLPPSLHFDEPNPEIDFDTSPFFVNRTLREWTTDGIPRRAGVSSFGIGGTNAHVIVEEAPPAAPSGASRPRHLLMLSAKTKKAVDAATTNLKEHLQRYPDVSLADVAYTLQVGRQAFSHRRAWVCRDVSEAIQRLDTPVRRARRVTQEPGVVFMLPGQGAQYERMGEGLYRQEPVFRRVVDQSAEILQPYLGDDIRTFLYGGAAAARAPEAAGKKASLVQPALFITEYALATLWQHWGVRPKALIGHSIGEVVAACLAGVFSLEDALRFVAKRSLLIEKLPTGAMLAVRSPVADLQGRLASPLSMAAINGPSLCVVAGPTEAVAALQRELDHEGLACRLLASSHAFHGPMMDDTIGPCAELLQGMRLAPPRLPLVSTVTGTWITPEQAQDPMYWARHARAPVRFSEAVDRVLHEEHGVLLETGPGISLATFARQQASNARKVSITSSLGERAVDNTEWEALLGAVGTLWTAGVPIHWKDFYAHESRRRLPLPTYPFERTRYWLGPEHPAASERDAKQAQKKADGPAVGGRRLDDGSPANAESATSVAHLRANVERRMQKKKGALTRPRK